MAVVHEASLTPTKQEALAAWLPQQSWAQVSEGAQLELVTSYRFDDPAGEVGMEVHLVRTAADPNTLIQIPLSYRGAEVPGLESSLVTTMDHSMLGKRWVYDGVADPVFAEALVRTIVESRDSAEVQRQTTNGLVDAPDFAQARGTGALDVHLAEAGSSGTESSTLPVVQETDGAAVIAAGTGQVALFRFPETAQVDPLTSESHTLRVRFHEDDDVELIAARLLA